MREDQASYPIYVLAYCPPVKRRYKPCRPSRPPATHLSRQPRTTEPEIVARKLAFAFGTGNALVTADFQFGPMKRWTPSNRRTGAGNEDNPSATAGLTICAKNRHGERIPDGMRQWDQTPKVGVMPRTRLDASILAALAYAKLTGPLEDWLRVYALQDWDRWPNVRRHALRLCADPLALDEAARMILFPIPRAQRAQQYRMRKENFNHWIAQPEAMLESWLERAARQFHEATG